MFPQLKILKVLQWKLHLSALVQERLRYSKAILVQVDHCGILSALYLLTVEAAKGFREVVLSLKKCVSKHMKA